MVKQEGKTGQRKRKLGKAIDVAKVVIPAVGAAAVVVIKKVPKIVSTVASVVPRK